jgi:hypothetical protein
MKKTTVKNKLVLHKETTRALLDKDMLRVGTGQDNGTNMTQIIGGCPVRDATPDPK